jgi:hypothetical protein
MYGEVAQRDFFGTGLFFSIFYTILGARGKSGFSVQKAEKQPKTQLLQKTKIGDPSPGLSDRS